MRRYRRTGLDFNRRKKDVNFPLLKEIFSWIIEIAIVLMMAFVLVYFIGMRTSVVGQSMSETLENGDQILVNRFMYKVIGPKANDVIVFLPNGNEKSHYYVKRVIGVPGDTVQIKDGRIYVNGTEFTEKVDVASIEDAGLAADAVTLGDDEYFVLGDNRNNSEDSRYANIGNIKREYIIGKAWFVISTGDRFGFIK
ncbi:MAG: signal peptidase I [Roseburia sp.]